VAAELLHSVAWQWVFLIPVPFCLAALLAGVAIQMPAGQKQETFLDLPGMVLGPLAFAALAYGMAETSTGWTSTGALAGLLGGSAALVAFIAVELRAPHPLLDLRVFGAGAFRLTVVTQWLGQIALAGGGFLFSQFLLLILGYHILDGGYTTLLLAQLLGTAVCLLIGGLLFDRRGARLPAVTGLALVTIGTVGLAQLSALTRPSDLLLWLFLQGAGSGLLTVALQTRMLSSVPRDLVRRVAALTGALQGMLVGLAGVILATVLTNRFGSLEPVLLTARLHHPLDIGAMLATALAPDYNHLLMIMAGFALAGALLALTLRPVLAPTDGEVPEKSWVEPEPDPAAISVDIPPGQPDV
jgi:MFS family permease